VPSTHATYLAKLFIFKSHPFLSGILLIHLFPPCTHNVLKHCLHYVPHSRAGSEAEELFGFKDKIFEKRKCDPG
jgi:hypothetical protein